MTTEYWLQKKTIGGWSMVTWYSELEQANANYAKCVGNGMSGYSWRLVEVNELEVAMLEEVVEIPTTLHDELINVSKDSDNKKVAWGRGNPSPDASKSSGWGQDASTLNFKAGNNPGVSQPASSDLQHGLSGSVWLVHHGLKIKTRVSADKVDAMMKEGYVKGSPRTQFE